MYGVARSTGLVLADKILADYKRRLRLDFYGSKASHDMYRSKLMFT